MSSRELISTRTEEEIEVVEEQGRKVHYRVTYEIRVYRVTRIVGYEEFTEPNPEYVALLHSRRSYLGWVTRYRNQLAEIRGEIRYLESRRMRYPPIPPTESYYIQFRLKELWSEWGSLMREIQLQRLEVEEIDRRLETIPPEITIRIPIEEEFIEEQRIEIEREKLFKRIQCAYIKFMYKRRGEYVTYQLKGVLFTNNMDLTHEDIHDIVTEVYEKFLDKLRNPWKRGGYGHNPDKPAEHDWEDEEVEPDEVEEGMEIGKLYVDVSCEETGWEERLLVREIG